MHPQRTLIEAAQHIAEEMSHEDIILHNHKQTRAALGVRGIRDIDDMSDKEKTGSYEKYVSHASKNNFEPISKDDYLNKLKRYFA